MFNDFGADDNVEWSAVQVPQDLVVRRQELEARLTILLSRNSDPLFERSSPTTSQPFRRN